MLHDDPTWGGGTTEYALDAIRAARRGHPYVCPVPLDTQLPMIDRRDLVHGLVALADAPASAIAEPTGGYALAGYSFSARQLFAELEALFPGFTYTVQVDAVAGHFAQLWCDSLSAKEATRDLHFTAQYSLHDTLAHIMAAELDD